MAGTRCGLQTRGPSQLAAAPVPVPCCAVPCHAMRGCHALASKFQKRRIQEGDSQARPSFVRFSQEENPPLRPSQSHHEPPRLALSPYHIPPK
jgi:hypothetical protein